MKFIIIIILIIILIFKYNYCIEYFSSNNIPKQIWTYWDGSDNYVPNLCINTWRKNSPGYNVTIINKDNINEYIDIDIYNLRHADSSARISDFIRLYLLSKYGGIWIDATVILTRSLDWIYSYKTNFIGFYKEKHTTNNDYKCIESWFLACTPNNELVKLWYKEFMNINNYNTIRDYVNHIKNSNIDLQNIFDHEYLTIYLSYQYVIQKIIDTKILNNITLLCLEDHDKLLQAIYSDNKTLLCKAKYNELPNIIKFSRWERDVIKNIPELECIYKRFL